jgi:hypothetical protein
MMQKDLAVKYFAVSLLLFGAWYMFLPEYIENDNMRTGLCVGAFIAFIAYMNRKTTEKFRKDKKDKKDKKDDSESSDDSASSSESIDPPSPTPDYL